MAQGHQRKPRKDVFAHFEREANKSFRSTSDYQEIQTKWAEARTRRDAFLHEYTLLEQKIEGIEVSVRPQLGREPHRLELIITIPEGVTTNRIKAAAPKIVRWRDSLTLFQGPSPFIGIEHLARIQKGSDGKLKLECSEPHLISEGLNQRLADLLTGVEYHRNDFPPDNPPFNSEWCLSEAKNLFLSWHVAQGKQERCIKECLQRIRSGIPAFETQKTRNGFIHLKGPFTARLVSERIRAWRRRQRGF